MVTEPCSSVRTVPVSRSSPCSRVAHCGASDFTEMSSEGSWPIACGDRFRGRFAVMRGPALQEPGRNVERLGFHFIDKAGALAGTAAQHRVDKAGIFRGAPVRLHQPHREIDGGVIGNVHPEDLRRANQERALRARRIGRNAAIEQPRQQMAERPEPAQDRRHQPAHQRAVAVGKCLESRVGARAVKLVVEGAVLVQDAVQNVSGDPPRRETGHFSRAS